MKRAEMPVINLNSTGELRRRIGRAGAAGLAALLLMLPAGCVPFIRGYVPTETGFEGAVAVETEDQSGAFGVVTVKIPYLDLYGQPAEGLARMVVHRRTVESGRPLPAFCHVHYEKDIGGAKKWAREGWAVFTAVYTGNDGKYPIDAAIGNGYNEARAILQWVRRLPFIDRARLHIDGGSQGGYMALAMSADLFPVTSATADCPVVNWAYNLAYFEANKPASGYPAEMKQSPLPVLSAVTMLGDWSFKYFSDDLSADCWYYLSPIAYLDHIASPVLVTCATGDMLVPMEQMTREHLRAVDRSRFPESYQRDFDTLTLCGKARKTFEECVPESARSIHIEPLQEDSFEITREMVVENAPKPRTRPKDQDKPWSKDHQWSLLYLDEGGPAPQAGHTTFEWSMSPDSFVAHYHQAEPAPAVLNAAKLGHLLQRYAGELEGLPALKDGTPANRLNFRGVEQRDVATGLLDYARLSPAHAERVAELYRNAAIKPFGESISLETVAAILESLAPAAVEP
jgi:hypothetical protein